MKIQYSLSINEVRVVNYHIHQDIQLCLSHKCTYDYFISIKKNEEYLKRIKTIYFFSTVSNIISFFSRFIKSLFDQVILIS